MQVLYQNLFVTAGKPTLGLVFSVLAGIANLVFDYLFIVLLQIGVKGAAFGTGIGYLIPALFGTIFILLVSCSLDAIFLLLLYLRHYPMERHQQRYLFYGHLDLLRFSF